MDNGNCIITEGLFDKGVAEKLYAFFADKNIDFKCVDTKNAPYVLGNTVLASNAHLLTLTIPVCKTLGADENGDFVLTLFIYGSKGLPELKAAHKRAYEIKINAKESGLCENCDDVRKVISVDLSSYDINIAEDEALGFFAASDTLYPAMLECVKNNSNEALNLVRKDALGATGVYVKASSEELAFSHDTALLGFEWQREYESEEKYLAKKNKTEYNKMVKALAPKYKGKRLSVLGDSISTFAGFCNDTNANVTIGSNDPFYPVWSPNVYSVEYTYWGKVADALGMSICIDNSWSGSSAYGRDFGKNMLIRCADLHRDGGTPEDTSDDVLPEVIFVYMSANDINGGSPLDNELLGIIESGSKKSDIDEWFAKVKETAEREGGAEKGKTFSNYAEVYALSMDLMKRKYPGAEMYCLTLQETNHPNTLKTRPERYENYNKTIIALANYFGASVVDQSKDEITWENCHAYAGDMSSLHPTAAGHEIMAENIIKVMYESLN